MVSPLLTLVPCLEELLLLKGATVKWDLLYVGSLSPISISDEERGT
jgi:hypothetical protein